MKKFQINIDEDFPHLPHAPIAEAVIDIRTRPTIELEEKSLKAQLEGKLINYDFVDSQQLIENQIHFELGKQPSQTIQWKGLKYQSKDKKQITQFNNDGFVFSRLEPYPNWKELYDESMRLWQTYFELAKPVVISRLGLRFINRIQLPADNIELEDYLNRSPQPPKGLDLPFSYFFHQDTLMTPDDAYRANIFTTVQPNQAPKQGEALIIDIDVFTTKEFELNNVMLEKSLLEMQWLKNKIFFGSVTEKTLALFK